MPYEKTIDTALSGIVAVKVLETGMKVMNTSRGGKIKKLKKIKKKKFL